MVYGTMTRNRIVMGWKGIYKVDIYLSLDR